MYVKTSSLKTLKITPRNLDENVYVHEFDFCTPKKTSCWGPLTDNNCCIILQQVTFKTTRCFSCHLWVIFSFFLGSGEEGVSCGLSSALPSHAWGSRNWCNMCLTKEFINANWNPATDRLNKATYTTDTHTRSSFLLPWCRLHIYLV